MALFYAYQLCCQYGLRPLPVRDVMINAGGLIMKPRLEKRVILFSFDGGGGDLVHL